MASSRKTAITNVRVFDGSKLTEPTTIVIQGEKIVSDGSNAVEIDGQGGTLLPGLIDAHVHIFQREELEKLAKAGITTALNMGSFPPERIDSFRNQSGLPDYYSAGLPLTAPGSLSSKVPSLPREALVVGSEQAKDFVSRRIADGCDYVKLVADIPGPDQETLDAAAAEARAKGKLTVAHAATLEPVRMAQKAQPNFLTHTPIDNPMADEDVELMAKEKRGCIPTLAMMELIHSLGRPGTDYENSRQSVKKMHEAGITILAGTDCNAIEGALAQPKHGESMARELELLVEAGLSTVETLRSVTTETAKQFGFTDRGVIEPGKRADLVLIEGDPMQDIGAVRQVRKVWCAGVEVS